MDKQTYSEGFKLFLRFLKEVKIYNYYKEYEKTNKSIPRDTNNILQVVGCTSISSWLEDNKRIYLRHNVYYTFKYWLKAFYPHFYATQKIPEVNLSEAKEYGIDIENRKVRLCVIKD